MLVTIDSNGEGIPHLDGKRPLFRSLAVRAFMASSCMPLECSIVEPPDEGAYRVALV